MSFDTNISPLYLFKSFEGNEEKQSVEEKSSKAYLKLTNLLLDPNEKDQTKAREIFDRSLDELPNAEERVEILCNALNCRDWGKKVSQLKDNHKYGLLAVKNNKITPEEFALMMFHWALEQDCPDKEIEFVQLFNEKGENNPEAEEIIDATVDGISENRASGLSKEDKKQLFEGMKKKPLSERQFMVIEENDDKSCITKTIRNLGVNIFQYYTRNGKRMSMIPSFALVNEFLKTKFGKLAVTAVPVINVSTIESLKENGRTATRDVYVPYPGQFVPEKADTLLIGNRSNFSKHDLIYHSILASCVPDEYRNLYIDISEKIEKIKNLDESTKIFANQVAETLIDMECKSYRPEARGMKTLSQLFWMRLGDMQAQAMTRLLDEGYSETQLGKMYKSFFPSFYELLLSMEEQLEKDYQIDWNDIDQAISGLSSESGFISSLKIEEKLLENISQMRKKSLSEKRLLELYQLSKEERTNKEEDSIKELEKLKNDKEFCLKMIKEDPTLFEYFSDNLKEDNEIGWAAVKANHLLFKLLGEKLKNDKELCLYALKKKPYLIMDCGDEIKKNKEFGLFVVKQNPTFIEFLDEDFKNDEELCLNLVLKDPSTLIHFGQEMKKNFKIGSIAVKKEGHLIQYLDEELKNHVEICKIAMQNDNKSMEYFGPKMKSDKDNALKIIELNHHFIQYLSEELKDDFDICLKVVQKQGVMFQYFGPNMQKNKQLILIAIQNSRSAVSFLDTEFFYDTEICAEIAKKSPDMLDLIKKDVMHDKKFILKILEIKPAWIKHLQDDIEICKIVMEEKPKLARFFNETLQKNKELCLIGLKKDPTCIIYFDETLEEDPDVIKILQNGSTINN